METFSRLGVTAARVKVMAVDARVGLASALWTAGMDDTLARVEAGEPVTLHFGTVSFLLLKEWAFLPLRGRDGRRCKLAVRAQVVPTTDGGRRIETDANDWAEEAEARRETSSAIAAVERMEEVRILGRRRVEALDGGDETEVRRIDKALDIVGQQVDRIGFGSDNAA